jgi:hypothetical protein
LDGLSNLNFYERSAHRRIALLNLAASKKKTKSTHRCTALLITPNWLDRSQNRSSVVLRRIFGGKGYVQAKSGHFSFRGFSKRRGRKRLFNLRCSCLARAGILMNVGPKFPRSARIKAAFLASIFGTLVSRHHDD